ncbi:FG-GAP repeat domain-containing protein [Streptomyces sp. NPDC056944]|uniref:FG-GAP repeat domain-containing protein n=1 Tax=Streptomyces sp. NPDC056944 TaxID=3345972 RepID=UPI00362726E5
MFKRRRPGLRTALVATAVTAATATGAASAVAAPAADPVVAPTFHLYGVHKQTHELWEWYSRGPLLFTDGPYGSDTDDHSDLADLITVDNDSDWNGGGKADGNWTLYKNGRLDFSGWVGGQWRGPKNVGRGWDIYRTVLSPGTLGGAKEADLIGLDRAGVLWSYLGYSDGRLTTRMRVGGGWGQYTELAGQGDLTGDGRADITARDKAGVLWLYKGTGDYKAPFAGRTKIGGGWNAYDRLLSLGDIDVDGKVDLLARKTTGELLRYSGTGNAARPFTAPVQIKGIHMKEYNLL